jgi:hypothetical protein
MRKSFLLVAVIRNVAVLANVASLVAQRFAASFKPEMYRLCYVHWEPARCGRSVGPMSGTWRSDRPTNQLGRDHGPIACQPDSPSRLGNGRTITRHRRDQQGSQQPRG